MAKPNRFLKVLKVLAIIFFSLLVILISIPFLFKGKIENMVKDTLNKSLEAEVNFSSTGLSLIRSFPNLELAVYDLTVTGVNTFEDIELFRAESVRLSFDLISLIKDQSDVELKSFHIFGADIQILVLPEGEANYDIYISEEDTVATESSDFRLNLKDYSIRNSNIHYVDLQGGMNVLIRQFNHSGSGNYNGSIADFKTLTVLDTLTFDYGGIRYLNAATISQDGQFVLNLDSSKYYIHHNEFKLNAMILDFDGYVHLEEEDIHMKIVTRNKGNDFSQFMSLIPGIYGEQFKNIQSSGSLTFAADVDGTYNGTKEIYPLFDFILQIDNGAFKYAQMSEKLDAVYADVKIQNPTPDLKGLTVVAKRLDFNLAGERFESNFDISQIFGNMNVAASLKGGLNLAKIVEFYPFEDMRDLRGLFRIDGDFNFKMDDVYAGNYASVQARGDASLNNFGVQYADYPNITVDKTNVIFSPQKLSIPQTTIVFGTTDFAGEMNIDNYLAYLGTEGKVQGSIKTVSRVVNVDELMGMMSSDETTVSTTTSTEVPFDRFNLNINSTIGEIKYTGYDIKELEFAGSINPQNVQINKFRMIFNGNTMNVDGKVNNLYGYLFYDEILEGIINFSSPFIDLDSFYADSPTGQETADTAEEGIIPVPADFKMVINTNINRLKYGEMNLNNVRGAIVVNEREAALENVTADGLGGKIKLNGLYRTPLNQKPSFKFQYELTSIEFRSAFNSVNTFQQLAPIAENISGRFNSTMSLEGDLNDNMFPDLNTLTANGFLQTINAVINEFEPLRAIGNKLNTNVFNTIRLKDSKNWFEVKNGLVTLVPFDFEFSDIKMVVSGNHSLTQNIDYKINADVPRALLEKSQLGSSVNTGISWLSQEASKAGLNIAQGENILMDIFLGGNIKSPTVRVVPTGLSDGKKQVQEQVKDRVQEEVTKVRDEITEKAKEESEKIVNEAKEKIQKETDDLAEKAKKELEDRMKDKIDDKKVDEAKDKLKKINPFKKN